MNIGLKIGAISVSIFDLLIQTCITSLRIVYSLRNNLLFYLEIDPFFATIVHFDTHS